MNQNIQKAVGMLGSQKALASAIGVSQVFVHHMATGEKQVPAGLCQRIEQATGVSRYDLRPDVFGEDPAKAKKPRKTA